jgi:CBS domain-containing protein
MRRVNIRAAFVTELSHAEDSDEAVALVVRGGEITVVVPRDTADGDVLDAATCVRGTLHLENERVLHFEIQDGAVGAFYEDEAADLHYRRSESGGLFSLSAAGRSPGIAPTVLARDLMITQVITAEPSMSVQAVAELLAFHRLSGLPVVDGGRLVGIVTEADVIGKQGNSVADIMTRDVVTVSDDTPAREVAQLLTGRGIRRVPVMRGDQLVGILSRGHIVRWVASHQ